MGTKSVTGLEIRLTLPKTSSYALPLGKEYNDEQLKLTVSAGVAEFSNEFSIAERLEKADTADARNQVHPEKNVASDTLLFV